MTDAAIEEAKAALRRSARDARAALSSAARADAARRVAAHLLARPDLVPAGAVAGYWPIRDELDCRPVLMTLLAEGRDVLLPVVAARDAALEFRLWAPDVPLEPSGFGTLAPSALAPQVAPDLILVPLLGFDARGTRLGYGGGYYDRTLAALPHRPRLVGLAFAAQELAAIPRDRHDFPLDAVVTEDGVRIFDEAR